MYLVFDTETNGLPKDWKASPTKVDNWPRVIQLAWLTCDEEFNVLTQHNYLIKPDGWEIPVEKFWIDNGFSQEKSLAEGVPLLEPLTKLAEEITASKFIVAHNMAFDYPVLVAEMLRAGVRAGSKPEQICTMKSSTDFCKIPGPYRDYKWPSLQELYFHLFSKDFEGAHDAMHDVVACYHCLYGLKQMKVI